MATIALTCARCDEPTAGTETEVLFTVYGQRVVVHLICPRAAVEASKKRTRYWQHTRSKKEGVG